MQNQLSVLKKLNYGTNDDILNILYHENISSHSFDAELRQLMTKLQKPVITADILVNMVS